MPALGISSTGAGNLGASGRLREGNEGGSGHWSTEQTAFDELHCFIIDSVVCLFSQFAQQVNDKTLDLFRVDKRKKNWTDKGDHDSYLIRSLLAAIAIPACTEGAPAVVCKLPVFWLMK